MAVALSGCTPYRGQLPSSPGARAPAAYHRVARGETLWSISRRYGVELSDLVRANGISDASRVEVGQRLRIPERSITASSFGVSRGAAAVSTPARPSAGSPSAGFVWPVQGRVISVFGSRGRGRVNKGVDIQAPSGAEVRAARGGRVDFVHEGLPGFGKTIILDHEDGFASVYAYVSEILVRRGEVVAQRQVIARVGRTGRAEVPALHFQIRRNQKPQNPLHYLP
ncbi:MAG: M23 family metallopeptidase [Candidatus Omnitrophica bacterium]|nr:M23 family metallopeptidase [Candidatus Omnitrophota bacterium]